MKIFYFVNTIIILFENFFTIQKEKQLNKKYNDKFLI